MRMLSSALRRNRSLGTFKYLKQSLLYALTRNIPGDGNILALFCDLIYFVDVNYTVLSTFNIIIGCLYELKQDVLNILAHITGLCKSGSIRNGKRYIKYLCQSLCQIGLSRTGRAHHQDIAFLKFNIRLIDG